MQRTLLMSGNGGQGVRVATKLVGAAAAGHGYALHFARYGTEVRGTEIEGFITTSEVPIEGSAMPSTVWGAVAMHPAYFEKVHAMVQPGGLLFFNSSMGDLGRGREDIAVVPIPASALAADLGAPIAASLVALGAFASHTGLVPVGDLLEALPAFIPPYRHELLEGNRRALLAGATYAQEAITLAAEA